MRVCQCEHHYTAEKDWPSSDSSTASIIMSTLSAVQRSRLLNNDHRPIAVAIGIMVGSRIIDVAGVRYSGYGETD